MHWSLEMAEEECIGRDYRNSFHAPHEKCDKCRRGFAEISYGVVIEPLRKPRGVVGQGLGKCEVGCWCFDALAKIKDWGAIEYEHNRMCKIKYKDGELGPKRIPDHKGDSGGMCWCDGVLKVLNGRLCLRKGAEGSGMWRYIQRYS